jgi:hypothetical protein
MDHEPPRFLCDAMLGGLARWLRAAGYDAAFAAGIDDGDLVRRAAAEGSVVLSSDGGIFDRNVVRRGDVRALFVPRATPPVEQLAFVLRELRLAPRESRCMACGGALDETPKDAVEAEVPPRAYAGHERFWRCRGCARVFWRGTHYRRISVAVDAAAARL